MSGAPDTIVQHEQALAELLELGLAAARAVQARLLAAEGAREACDLSLAFNRISRSVRQTLALQAKLDRGRRRQGREEAADARRAQEVQVALRKAQVRAAVERAVWTEAEDAEAERLLDDLDDLVSEEALYPGFAEGPVAAHVERIRRDLGLSACRLREAAGGGPSAGEPMAEGASSTRGGGTLARSPTPSAGRGRPAPSNGEGSGELPFRSSA